MTKELICISCPVGCLLKADFVGESDIKITGNSCNIGINYGINELKDPRRVVTSSVAIKNGQQTHMISLKTNGDIPKNRIFDVLAEMKKLQLSPQEATLGNVVIANVLDLGTDIVVTRGYE